MILLHVFLIAIIFTAVVQGTNYYVSSRSPARSDSNKGTDPSAPWATLNKVDDSY